MQCVVIVQRRLNGTVRGTIIRNSVCELFNLFMEIMVAIHCF